MKKKIKKEDTWISFVIKGICFLIYPPRCPICHGILKKGEGLAHEECKKKLVYVKEPRCFQCGKPVMAKEIEFCYDCSQKKHVYTKGLSVFLYNSVMKKSIYEFKYNNKREYGDFYAQEIVRELGEHIKRWKVEAIIPVPLHKSRRKRRGFNQAELVANKVGQRLGIPVEASLVARTRKTLPQKQLNDKERQNNLKKAFKMMRNDVKLSTAIILDDIYTTGSTVDEVAAVLRAAGVEKVYVICIAIGKGIDGS